MKKVVGHQKKSGAHAHRLLSKKREACGQEPLEKTAVYRFLRGETHRTGTSETRGRHKILTNADLRTLQQARRRLIKKADNEERITWKMVIDEADLEGPPCQRVVEDAMRHKGCRFRPPRRKIGLTAKDAKKRVLVGKEWIKEPASYWTNGKKVHGYYDNKNFPYPRTAKERKRLKDTNITGHLRMPGEGLEQGFTKPRTTHSFLGIPSVTVSALLAKDRIVMWHIVKGNWNGARAAEVYAGPMRKALLRTYGAKRSFTIVEDGDRKGNQSGKGMAAKAAAHIVSKTLPPRTPCWMPLDYAVWKRIMDKVLEGGPEGRETKEQFLARLKRCAMSLPRPWVAKQIARMKTNIQEVLDARGYHPKSGM